MKMNNSPCETCPHRQPMDKARWAEIAKAQRKATPELSRAQCAKLTRIERKSFEGLEANVENCKGYSPLKTMAGYLLGKISTAHKIKKTEAGGTRFASWHERACNNPYLDSPEYFELQDEFQATGSEAAPSMFKSDRQREAYIEDNVATQKMLLGCVVLSAGTAIYEAAPEPIAAVGGGMIGIGIYTAAAGGARLIKALGVQIQEGRKNS